MNAEAKRASTTPGRIGIGVAIVVFILGLGIAFTAGGHHETASPIPPGASSADIAFLHAMDSHGIEDGKGPQAAIDLAHQICGLLNSGMTVNGLAEHYTLTTKSDLDGGDMHFFIQTAAAAYCPQNLR